MSTKSNYTHHYNLQKPLSTEKYNVSVANENMSKIDDALNEIENNNMILGKNLTTTKGELESHRKSTSNPHKVDKDQLGLSEVTNNRQIVGNESGIQEGNVVLWGENGYELKDSGCILEQSVTLESELTDTIYEHPDSHPATMITQDENNRFVSDAEKLMFADKYTKSETDQKMSTIATPSKLSELTNDMEFVTNDSLNSVLLWTALQRMEGREYETFADFWKDAEKLGFFCACKVNDIGGWGYHGHKNCWYRLLCIFQNKMNEPYDIYGTIIGLEGYNRTYMGYVTGRVVPEVHWYTNELYYNDQEPVPLVNDMTWISNIR